MSIDRERMRRVAIFQGVWGWQLIITNCAETLARAGYVVEVFLYDAGGAIQLDELGNIPDIILHDLSLREQNPATTAMRTKRFKSSIMQGPLRPILSRLYNRLPESLRHWREHLSQNAYALYLLLRDKEAGLLPKQVLERTLSLMSGKHYRCLIGIEKKGLVWAGKVAERLNIPYMYHSLELYTSDHPDFRWSILFQRLKRAEQRYHRKSLATIVQDSERAAVLLRDNGVSSGELFFVPVSVQGGPCRQRTTFFQDKFHLPQTQRMILCFGNIESKYRFAPELVRIAQQFPQDWSLVMHGRVLGLSLLPKLRQMDRQNRVIFSLELVPGYQLAEVASSTHIGLVLYRPFPKNELLTVFSSHKIALYLQCGLPIIAFDYPGYRRLMAEHPCGVLINKLEELPSAIERIFSSYEEFRQQAFECFTEHYEFSRQFDKVIRRIDKL